MKMMWVQKAEKYMEDIGFPGPPLSANYDEGKLYLDTLSTYSKMLKDFTKLMQNGYINVDTDEKERDNVTNLNSKF